MQNFVQIESNFSLYRQSRPVL